MTNLAKKLGFATLLAFGSATSVQALVLDTFDYDTVVLQGGTANGDVQTTSLPAVTSTVPAGDVTYTLTTTSTSTGVGPQAGSSSTDGAMFLFNSNGTSNLLLEYSDADATMPIDLTDAGAANQFYFDVEFIDLGFSVDLTVTDLLNNVSTVTYTQLTAIPASSPTERVYVSFSDFMGTADFSSVQSIDAEIKTTIAGADLTISEVGTVPEPTSIALFGLALVGFAFSAKRKAK